MYTLRARGLPWLGTVFALLTALAAFGIGNMVQANSVAHSLQESIGLSPAIVGVVLVVLSGAVILGGIKRIAVFAEVLVPFMAFTYLGGGLVVLSSGGDDPARPGAGLPGGLQRHRRHRRLCRCHHHARAAIRSGPRPVLQRGGSGQRAAGARHGRHRPSGPTGLYGIFEVFVDTILICSVTGLAILTRGLGERRDRSRPDQRAFQVGLPGIWGDIVVTTGLVLFAFSTLIGWSYYGETGSSTCWAAARPAVSARLAGLHLPRRRGLAASGLGRRRYAQWSHGDSQPRLGADLSAVDPAADARVLRAPAVRAGKVP